MTAQSTQTLEPSAADAAAVAVAEPAHGAEIVVPLNRLKASPRNARKVKHSDAGIEALAASIKAKGVLQPPVVEVERDGEGAPTGSYLVTIGEGRRQALRRLAKRKAIKRTHPVRVIVDAVNDAHEISIDENITREAMHPADQFEAFRRLADARNNRVTSGGGGDQGCRGSYGDGGRLDETRIRRTVADRRPQPLSRATTGRRSGGGRDAADVHEVDRHARGRPVDVRRHGLAGLPLAVEQHESETDAVDRIDPMPRDEALGRRDTRQEHLPKPGGGRGRLRGIDR